MSRSVKAECFNDKIGYQDNNLYDGNYWYAELSKDYKKKDYKALGGLPYKYKLKITYKGKSVVAMKGDIQVGGPNHSVIALHKILADSLRFPCRQDLIYIQSA